MNNLDESPFPPSFQDVYVPFSRMMAMSPIAAAASTVTAQTQGVHPGFTLTNLRPAGFNSMMSGLGFLPDGRLARLSPAGALSP